MNMKWLPKMSSVDIKSVHQVNWWEILALVGLGLIIALMQANLRLPLKLPGWRGLIWLTPLVATRLSTSFFGASSITGLSAAGCSWLLGVRNDPFDWFFLLVVGEFLDLAYATKKWRKQVWFWAVVAGLVHLIKPLTRLVISIAGIWGYGVFANGYVYPLAMHLLFGVSAGLVGSGLILWTKKLRRNPQP